MSFIARHGWLIRAAALATLGVAVTATVAPHVTHRHSSAATVNAPLATLRAGLKGRVERVEVAVGDLVAPGDPLLRLAETETDDRFARELEARIEALKGSEDAAAGQIARLSELRAALEARQGAYLDRLETRFALETRALEAELRAAGARLAQARREQSRADSLSGSGFASKRAAEDAGFEVAAGEAEIKRLAALIRGARLAKEAAGRGILLDDGGADAPYATQRLDEIDLRLAALEDERADHRAERASAERALARERAYLKAATTQVLRATSAGVVRRIAAEPGRPVLPGDRLVEIVDCDRRFVEAWLDERAFGVLAPGEIAAIRFAGGGEIEAPVTAVMGAGARLDEAALAARNDAPKAGDLRVTIALTGETPPKDPARFCHVGRSADVSFPRRLSLKSAP